jgi:hypothetical protein
LSWTLTAATLAASYAPPLAVEATNGLASTGILYNQPANPSGGLYLSALLEPDGSASDEWVWDDFTLGLTHAITEVQWRGGYDPNLNPGGPVIGFKIKFYPTNLTGLEPDVNNPLVSYTLNDNAGETPAQVLGGVQTYDYHYVLPTPFQATAGTKYWVQIEGVQQGGIGGSPTWGLSAGMNGDGYRFRRYSNGGIYRIFPGDTAFALLGPVVLIYLPIILRSS